VPNSRRLIVIVKLRPFDEAAWKRLLIAYAYALYDKQGSRPSQSSLSTDCELFLLHTKLTPDRLRIDMSRTLSVIRTVRAGEATARPSSETRPVSPSPVEELAKLADMLEKDLLTREEFDLMKAKILGSPTIRSVGQYRPSGQCAGIRIRTSASCPLSGIDAKVPFRPTSP